MPKLTTRERTRGLILTENTNPENNNIPEIQNEPIQYGNREIERRQRGN